MNGQETVEAVREHGTLRQYVIGKCRCGPCTTANRDYANGVSRLKAYGRWEPYVDAEPVRQHVRALSEYGIGWQRAARLAGVSAGAVNRLLYGQPDRGPSKRLRPETAARLLAVRPTLEAAAPRAVIDSTGTRRRAHALIARGFPLKRLAARLGVESSNLSKTLRTEKVTVATAQAVSDLYDELWDQDPAAAGIPAKSIAYARNLAVKRGWAPPGAWDDATIDDPAARPQLGERTGRPLAVWEDAEFVRRTTGVEDRNAIAERLGITRVSLDQNLARAQVLLAAGGAR